MSKNLPLELLQEAERIAKSAVENYSEALKLVQETGDISQKIILHIKFPFLTIAQMFYLILK